MKITQSYSPEDRWVDGSTCLETELCLPDNMIRTGTELESLQTGPVLIVPSPKATQETVDEKEALKYVEHKRQLSEPCYYPEAGSQKQQKQTALAEVVSVSTTKGVFHQLLLTSAVLLLAAGCGMPIGYSAVLLPQLYDSNETLAIDIEMGSWIASVHSLATPIGSFASGPIMDRWGRRPAILLAIVPLFGGWVLLATASSHFLLLLGRVVAGISVGLTAAPAQVRKASPIGLFPKKTYRFSPPKQILLAEIAEPRLRGLLIGAPFVSYSLGILLVYALGSQFHWREVAWGGTVLPLLSFVALFFAPESPVWLARNNQPDRAAKALTWLRGCPVQAKQELHKLTERFEQEQQQHNRRPQNFWRSLGELAIVKPLIIINAFHVLQILSGTYLVVFYAVDIISDMGGSDINSIQAAVLTAIVRLAFTFLYCFLLLMMPRRLMVTLSGLGSGLSCVAIAAFMYIRAGEPKTPLDTYVAATLILIYIGANTGFMTMPGIMIGELLPAKIRGQIAGYLFTIFNLLLFGVAKGFPYAKAALKTQGLFLMFGIASFAASLLLFLLLPETKGRSLHDIEDYFRQRNWLWMNRKRAPEEEQQSGVHHGGEEGKPLSNE
ncbi:facilitated trehalose transporter Tret1-2 homolog isoform X2 [Anopheles merus]|uniref:facilitated trehalose transporter Tret1-2 homolog isoform X2 n=1 Tax=Anopheles merus TaxID=30066 RepID=UPI001BE4C3C8|nr:facilitated trehalose transporter Tret1-2 homolog isoform X2 [Anopheles merus]